MIEYTLTIPKYADLMTVQEFKDSVEMGCFIDYDGDGHPVKDGKMSWMHIRPSKLKEIPEDATHIAWFNR